MDHPPSAARRIQDAASHRMSGCLLAVRDALQRCEFCQLAEIKHCSSADRRQRCI